MEKMHPDVGVYMVKHKQKFIQNERKDRDSTNPYF